MGEVRASAERAIPASASRVYAVIRDIRGRPQWVPSDYSNFAIQQGGEGEGTVYTYHLKTGTRERDYRMRVEEPEPGKVLEEIDQDSSLRTRWTVTSQGNKALVRIETAWQGAGGIGGFFERTFAPRVLSGMYQTMLERLANYVGGMGTAP
jgi:uncharacterized protein YndB with AHSA1/START domain